MSHPGSLVPFTIIGSRSMDKGHANEVHAYLLSCEERFEALSILFDFPPIARPFALAAAIRSECSVSKYLTMNSFERFKRFSTGAGLLVLAVGFSSLGFLSLINRHPEDAATGFFSEATYSIIGSSSSILVGATFLVAAILFAGTLLREKRPFAPAWRKDRRRDAAAFRR